MDDDKGEMKDVAKVMSTWTDQIGYPVVTINTTTGQVSQKRFLYNDTVESRFVLKILYCQSRNDMRPRMFVVFIVKSATNRLISIQFS